MNKIDALDDVSPHIDVDDQGKPTRVWVSAQTGEGIDLLFEALTAHLSGQIRALQLAIPPAEGRLRAAFYELNCIENESYDENGDCLLDIRINNVDLSRLRKQFDGALEACIK
jgi:GTP-binding protein HflX